MRRRRRDGIAGAVAAAAQVPGFDQLCEGVLAGRPAVTFILACRCAGLVTSKPVSGEVTQMIGLEGQFETACKLTLRASSAPCDEHDSTSNR
jgi:hypothetical protein